MDDDAPTIDLAFSRWASDEVVLGVMAVLGVLAGAALLTWPAVDALTSRQLDNGSRALIAGLGLAVAASMSWGLRDLRAFMRARLLVGPDGVQLDARGETTYRWSQIERFEVVGPHDFMGLPSAGAVMRLRDGSGVVLVRLDHLGGDGRNSKRAVAKISDRVATMNRLLDEATARAGDAARSR